jgi:hypothetical protein
MRQIDACGLPPAALVVALHHSCHWDVKYRIQAIVGVKMRRFTGDKRAQSSASQSATGSTSQADRPPCRREGPTIVVVVIVITGCRRSVVNGVVMTTHDVGRCLPVTECPGRVLDAPIIGLDVGQCPTDDWFRHLSARPFAAEATGKWGSKWCVRPSVRPSVVDQPPVTSGIPCILRPPTERISEPSGLFLGGPPPPS